MAAQSDVSDFMIVRQSDKGEGRFQIVWVCRGVHRPTRPLTLTTSLSDNNRHLVVTINDTIYYDGDLPGEAADVEYDVKPSGSTEQVFIIVHKREPGLWTRK